MRALNGACLPALNQAADRLYSRWVEGLRL
jgi:hypothetical protein